MDFALKVSLSFLIGGAYVSGVIWLSERLGSRIGGIIAGLPSTILVGLAFINLTEGSAAAQVAVSIVPLIFLAALIYGLVFLKLVRNFKEPRQNLKSIAIAVLAWLAFVLPVRFIFANKNFLLICAISSLGLLAFSYFFRNFSTTLPKKLPLPKHMYAIRFITGGTVIAAAVLAARILGPVWGGVVSSLPALLGSVLYFLNKSQGDKFLEGFLRLLPLSYVSSFVFLILIHQLLTKLPGVLAFTVAMSGALLCTSAILFFKRT